MKIVIAILMICLFVGCTDIETEKIEDKKIYTIQEMLSIIEDNNTKWEELVLLSYELGYKRGQNDMMENYLENNEIFYTDSLFKQGYEDYCKGLNY